MDIDVTTLDPEQPLTRDEIEALERAKRMLCRGRLPDAITDAHRKHFSSDVREVFEYFEIPEDASPRDVVNWLLDKGAFTEARQLDAALRTPCGYDFTEFVLAHPFDGEERAYECPKCGATGTIRSPMYTVRQA